MYAHYLNSVDKITKENKKQSGTFTLFSRYVFTVSCHS